MGIEQNISTAGYNLERGIASAEVRLVPASIGSSVQLPLGNGSEPQLITFDGLLDARDDHFALSFPGRETSLPLVRMHSSCVTGDVLGSLRCDCGPQLHEAIERLSCDGGILLYLQQEGRGIGLAKKVAAYALQDLGLDTFEANRRLGFPNDLRNYRLAAQMLTALGATRIRLLTNNPDKTNQLKRWGIDVADVQQTSVNENSHNTKYLTAKRDQSGHNLALGATGFRRAVRGDGNTPI